MGNMITSTCRKATIVLLVALLVPSAAFAADSIREVKHKRDGTLEIVNRYVEEEGKPDAEKEIKEGTTTYKLVSTRTEKDPDYEPEKKMFTYSTPATWLTISQSSDPASYFGSEHSIDEGEYVGTIPYVNADIIPTYESHTDQVDQIETYSVHNNDVNYLVSFIGSNKSYTVLSDAYPGATENKLLDIAGISYKVTGQDEYGLPTEYEATVLYRGTESYLVLDGYNVVANYAGEVASNKEGSLLITEYEEVVEEAVVDELTPAAELEEKSFIAWPFIVGPAGIVATIVGIIFWIKRKIHLVEVERHGKARKIEKMRPIANATGARVEITKHLTPNEHSYFLQIPKRYLKKYTGTALTVVNKGNVLYSGEWKSEVALSSFDDATEVAGSVLGKEASE